MNEKLKEPRFIQAVASRASATLAINPAHPVIFTDRWSLSEVGVNRRDVYLLMSFCYIALRLLGFFTQRERFHVKFKNNAIF